MRFLEQRSSLPVLGVMPWLDVRLPAEDSLDLEHISRPRADAVLDVAVVELGRQRLQLVEVADPAELSQHRALLIVHHETSTGVTTDLAAVRRSVDASGHDPLLLVDTVSSLGSIDFRFEEWRVDVALTGTQKGLMLPPGTAVLCVGERAQAAAETSIAPRYFYDWRPVLDEMAGGFFPYTPATLLLFGMREALRMLLEEGLENVFARHARLAGATRRAVAAWDLALLCQERSEPPTA